MSRPVKCRRVECEIRTKYFKPQGIPLRDLEEITLAMDELEAIRLSCIEEMYHADAARQMGVSRQTFGNILAKAHKKIATALINGKALRIGENLPCTTPLHDESSKTLLCALTTD